MNDKEIEALALLIVCVVMTLIIIIIGLIFGIVTITRW